MSFSAYLYDTQNQLVAARSGECPEKLATSLIHLLENYPIGTVGIVYDHMHEQVVGSYTRRIIE